MSEYVLKDTVESIDGELFGVFSLPPSSVDTKSIDYVKYRTVSDPSTYNTSLIFDIANNGSSYISLEKSSLIIKGRMKRNSGQDNLDPDPIPYTPEAIHTNSRVGPVNSFFSSLFSCIELTVGNQETCTQVSSNYSYRSYIDLLFSSKSANELLSLESELFCNDNVDGLPSKDPFLKTNSGLLWRGEQTSGSKLLVMKGSIYCDLCQQKRLILNGVPLNFTMRRSKDEFCLMSDITNADFTFVIQEAVLEIAHVKPSSELLVGHSLALQKSAAKYPFFRSYFRTFSIPSGSFQFQTENLFQNRVPVSMVVFLLSSQQYQGSYKHNPYLIHNNGLQSISFLIDSKVMYGEPLKMDFSSGNSDYVDAYKKLFTETNNYPDISKSDFPLGFCIYAFKMTNYPVDTLPLDRKGHTRLELIFTAATVNTLTVAVYAKLPGLMLIDAARNVSLE
jgi:hypothetical protein